MIRQLANLFTALVALSHVGFLVLEMFFWNHPVGQRIFSMTPEVSASTAVLAVIAFLLVLLSPRRT